jgi:pyruvate dehydrogenase E2 component (dihydrolipoamide acetyltransferase)
MTIFTLPDLGEGLAEAEIVRWHVNVGDAITTDQPMLAVETAKAIVEVPAPFSGIVTKLHGKPGDVIPTGAPLVEFDAASTEATAPPATYETTAGTLTAAAARIARASSDDAGTVVGNMPTSDEELIETAHSGARSGGANGTNGAKDTDATNSAAANRAGYRLRAAPAARALAKTLGVDLERVTGSGRGGVVVVEDVIAHSGIAHHRAPGKTGPATSGFSARGPLADAASAGASSTLLGTDGEKLRGPRRAMAQSMALARDNVASCTIFDDADLHRWSEGQDITIRLLRAIAAGCLAEPALNAWYDGNTQSRLLMTRVNIGMAVDTPDGLIVPVIRDAGGRTGPELRHEVDRLKHAARERTATPDDLREVTFMLSNFGMIAGRYATPVVVPPSVAILGSGRLSRDVVAGDAGLEAHLRMPLSLTFDHRCVTGGEAARFLAAVLCDLEKDN